MIKWDAPCSDCKKFEQPCVTLRGYNYTFQIIATFPRVQCVNSLGPSDTIWRWRSWSTLIQVMACCLTAPSHYLNQCWLIISKVLWHSSEDIIIRRFEDTNQYSKIENYIFKMTLRSPRDQWVKWLVSTYCWVLPCTTSALTRFMQGTFSQASG